MTADFKITFQLTFLFIEIIYKFFNQRWKILAYCFRDFINNTLRKNESQISIFCVCDGGDKKNTVLLGSSQKNNAWLRTSVHVLPCCKETDSITTLEFMKKDHLQATRGCTQVFLYKINNCF